jgi:hypothetical protein
LPQKTLYSVIESPLHPRLSTLYRRLGLDEEKLNSVRKAIGRIKKQQPDFIVADFCYGYSNNYSNIHISNLDVLLTTLQKYAPTTRVIVLADRSELEYAEKLRSLYPFYALLPLPVEEQQMEQLLTA